MIYRFGWCIIMWLKLKKNRLCHLGPTVNLYYLSVPPEWKGAGDVYRLTENSYIDLLDLSTHAEIAVTWDDDNLKEYSRKCHRGCDNLQLLKEYVHTPLQKKHIDSLCLLLWNKELLLSKAMHTFEELQGIGDIVQESIPSIVSIARKQAVQQKKNVNDNPCPLSLQLGQQYVCSVPLNGRSILGQAERQERLLV